MARFKASRFLKSPKVAKAVDQKAESGDEAEKASPATEAPPAARVVEPMRTRPVVQQQESHVDTSRRVDPGQTMRRVDPTDRPTAAPQEKPDSSATSAADERGPSGRMDPGSVGVAGDYDAGSMGKSVDEFTADDFESRSSAEGIGGFKDPAEETPAGADRIPTDNGVESSLAADEATLVDPADMANDGPEMPAGFDKTPGNMRSGNLSGLAGDADTYGSNSMADASGFAEEDADAVSTTDSTGDDGTSTDDQTSADGTSLSEDERKYLDAAGATETLEDEGYNVDDMTADQVHDALNDIADNEQILKPGKDYLEARDYDTGNMTEEQIRDALNTEASYEISGGAAGTATSPSYVDADSGGEGSAQVDADAAKLHIPTSPIRGNIDPTDFGNGAEEVADTSILGMSDPMNPDDSTSFGGGSIGTPPPTAGVDFGPDHVDQNPGGGLSEDIGGVGIGHDDGTLDVDLGTDDGTLDPDTGGVLDDLSQMDDPSQMADTPDIGFAVEPDDMTADDPTGGMEDNFRHIDRVDDIFE